MIRLALLSVALVGTSAIGCSGGKATTSKDAAPDEGKDAVSEALADVVAEAPADVSPAMAVAGLNGLRWELPCSNNFNGYCDTPAEKVTTAVVTGNPGAVYEVQLRFRGVIEEKTYADGVTMGHWQVGGTPAADLYNVYKLEVDQPPQVFYVNAGSSSNGYCVAVDFMASIKAATGATVTLSADSVDGVQVENSSEMAMPLVVPGIPPAPAAYDGQFVQMDVVAVTQAIR